MNQEDKEALFMILQRNGRKEINRTLDSIIQAMETAEDLGFDPYDIDLKGVE